MFISKYIHKNLYKILYSWIYFPKSIIDFSPCNFRPWQLPAFASIRLIMACSPSSIVLLPAPCHYTAVTLGAIEACEVQNFDGRRHHRGQRASFVLYSGVPNHWHIHWCIRAHSGIFTSCPNCPPADALRFYIPPAIRSWACGSK